MDSSTGDSANDGLSWANCFESILDWWDLSPTDGDTVYIASRHTESYTTSEFNQNSMVAAGSDVRKVSTRLVAVEYNTTNYEAMDAGGGLFTVTGNATNWGAGLAAYGLKSTGGYFRAFGRNNAPFTSLFDCTVLGGASGNVAVSVSSGAIRIIDSKINNNNANALIPTAGTEKMHWQQIGGELSTSRASTSEACLPKP